jgi:GntR family transcriptional regulator
MKVADPFLSVRVDKQSPTPVYLQIAESLRSLLGGGAMPPGTLLPPERVLCERYAVSRMTLRQAFDTLEREGLIETQRGRGTFVAHRRMNKQQQEMRSFTEEILSRGGVPSTRLLAFRMVNPGARAREFFGLPRGQQVYEIQRLRCSNGEPLALETVQIPCFLCAGLERFDLANHSLYSILEENYGLRLDHCIEEISAARPDPAQRRALTLPLSGAVLVIQRKTYTENDTPVELDVSVYRGDSYTAIVRSVRARS